MESDTEINSHMLDYFSQLFSSVGDRNLNEALSVVQPLVTESMNRQLISMLSEEEVRIAVFQLGAVKAPGPDGFPGFFFQHYWDVVGTKVYQAVRSFFVGGYLLKEFNQTNLVLIPKVGNPTNLSQFRPISLCNFIVKIITKILANRLKKVLGSLISPNQSLLSRVG